MDHSVIGWMRAAGIAPLVLALVSGVQGQSYCDPGYALACDGSDDHALVPYHATFPTEVFSVVAWVRTPGSFGRRTIVARGEDSVTGNAVWNLYMQAGGTLELRIEDISDADFSYPSTAQIADNVWHQVGATRNGAGAVALYLDGQQVAFYGTSGVPSSANSQVLSIGCTNGTFGPPGPNNPVHPLWFFPGLIDEPSIWNIALSSSQMQSLFTDGVDPGAAGLVGFWPMNEGSGQVISDASPLGNHGILGRLGGVDVADPNWFSEPPQISNYCIALPNSTGTTASISTQGSVSVLANSFVLTAQGATPNQFAIFFYGPGQTQTPLGDGFLCIAVGGSGLFRLVPPLVLDSSGATTRAIDFGTAPTGAGAGQILPGSTWNFQMWHRDSTAGGGSGSNLTDAVSVIFYH